MHLLRVFITCIHYVYSLRVFITCIYCVHISHLNPSHQHSHQYSFISGAILFRIRIYVLARLSPHLLDVAYTLTHKFDLSLTPSHARTWVCHRRRFPLRSGLDHGPIAPHTPQRPYARTPPHTHTLTHSLTHSLTPTLTHTLSIYLSLSLYISLSLSLSLTHTLTLPRTHMVVSPTPISASQRP